MEELWECLTEKDGRRQALIQIREQLRKDGAAAHAKLRKLHSKDTEVLGRLLFDEDAKTRTNAALVIGEIADNDGSAVESILSGTDALCKKRVLTGI